MIRVNTLLDNKCWNKRLKETPIFFKKLISYFPPKYHFKNKKVNFTVLLSDNHKIKKLNNKFRKKNKPTDVLSFPFDKIDKKKIIYLGDIIISYEFMNKPKKLSNLEFQDKVIKTFIHGFLHLLNYDHKLLKDFKKMNKEELKIYSFINKKIEKFI